MSAHLSPHSSDSRSISQLLVTSPPSINHSTFQAAAAPNINLLQQPSPSALRAAIINCLRTLSCAEGLTATCAPYTSSDTALRTLSSKLQAAPSQADDPTPPTRTPRTISSPLSPLRTHIVDRVKDLALSPPISDAPPSIPMGPRAPVKLRSPYSDDEEEGFPSPARTTSTSLQPLRPTLTPLSARPTNATLQPKPLTAPASAATSHHARQLSPNLIAPLPTLT